MDSSRMKQFDAFEKRMDIWNALSLLSKGILLVLLVMTFFFFKLVEEAWLKWGVVSLGFIGFLLVIISTLTKDQIEDKIEELSEEAEKEMGGGKETA